MRIVCVLMGGLFALAPATAFAESFSVDSECCGALYYHVGPGGSVRGEYPKQDGRIFGTVGPEGAATGIWTQPRSDHPCVRPRNGSFAWGRFVIRNIGTPDISGEWGYCDEYPNRGWGFR
jgi:hypothetical protein